MIGLNLVAALRVHNDRFGSCPLERTREGEEEGERDKRERERERSAHSKN